VLRTPTLATPTHPLPQPPQAPPQKALKNSEKFWIQKRGKNRNQNLKTACFSYFKILKTGFHEITGGYEGVLNF